VDDLVSLIVQKQQAGADLLEWFALQYHHNMVSGQGKLTRLDNVRYPEVQPEAVEQFAHRMKRTATEG
jgi:hypothetical protein